MTDTSMPEHTSMTSRRTDVFFYGLFMDQDLLRAKGIEPQAAQLASVSGFVLRIGQRAAMAPDANGRVHGVVMSLTQGELEHLYSEPSVQAYKPHEVLAQLATGGTTAALCYNLSEPPAASERNPEYAAKLRVVAERVGLPPDYVASIQ